MLCVTERICGVMYKRKGGRANIGVMALRRARAGTPGLEQPPLMIRVRVYRVVCPLSYPTRRPHSYAVRYGSV